MTELKVHDPVAVPPAVRVTVPHDTMSPVGGVDAVVKVTFPANPFRVPPRLASDSVEVPLLPVVTETGVLAERLKSLITAVIEPEVGTL